MKNFKHKEFDSPDKECSGLLMDADFLEMLDAAREIADIPFKINSGYRTVSHNASIGGKKDSSHLKGLAADIHCTDSRSRFIIKASLIAAGFSRIGQAKTFIHVDFDNDKSQRVEWLY
ncbi:MAG: peptidase M15 [Flavobacteriales bacterium]|nr:peptidase M15 [Flavobacteriales bacterium]